MKLLDYLPEYLKDIKEFKEIMNSEEEEIHELKDLIQDKLNQKFVDTATWGLEFWEKELGLQVNPNLPYEERRARIKGRLRGVGKCDSDLIKQVVDSWTNGNVDVSFEDCIKIKFNSIYGVPSNIEDLQNAIKDIKPVHLKVEYDYIYLLIKDIHNAITINKLQNTQLNKFAGGEVNA